MAGAPLKFALKFLVLFAVLAGGFEASRGTAFERWLVEGAILTPTVALIDAVTPAEHAVRLERTLAAPGGPGLHVIRGCEGIELFLMLVAAIAAFPATLARRALGLAIGVLLAYVLSVLRLMALYYTLRYSPAAWEALHGLILPLGPVVLMALYFLRWSAAEPAVLAIPATGRAA